MAVIAPPLGGLMMGPISIFFGPGADPNAAAADNKPGDLAGSGIGSLYISRADGSLWSKTGATDVNHPTGTWTTR